MPAAPQQLSRETEMRNKHWTQPELPGMEAHDDQIRQGIDYWLNYHLKENRYATAQQEASQQRQKRREIQARVEQNKSRELAGTATRRLAAVNKKQGI